MTVSAKTLRKLGKSVGIQPSKLFRMQPEEIVEAIKETGLDIKDWDDKKAEDHIVSLKPKEKPAPKQEAPKEVKSEAKEEPKKRNRRTKAQIAADKEKQESMAKQEERKAPSRRRKKKNPAPRTPETLEHASIEEIKERVINLEEDIKAIKSMSENISGFLMWFHNLQLDPHDPHPSLDKVDWDDAIDCQLPKK